MFSLGDVQGERTAHRQPGCDTVRRMLVHDVIPTSQRTKTPQGFLLVPGAFSRTGIHDYRAGQVGITDRPASDVVKVWRPPSEVFDSASMASFGRVPVTNNHPGSGTGEVTLDNMDSLGVGMSDPEVVQDGDLMRGTILVTCKDAIAAIEGGKNQLSNGYHANFEITAGVTEAGEHYDAIQRNIRGNHIAIVDAGRGGARVAIADEGDCPVKITIDGNEYEVDQKVADAIKAGEAAQKTVADAKAKDEEEEAEKKAKGGRKEDGPGDPGVKKDSALEKDLATTQAQLDAALERIPTDAQLDARADTRAAVLSVARRLDSDVVTDGKSNEEIRKAVVVKLVGDEMSGKSNDYIEGRFDILADGGGESARFADRNLNRGPQQVADEDVGSQARAKHIEDASNAWQTPTA